MPLLIILYVFKDIQSAINILCKMLAKELIQASQLNNRKKYQAYSIPTHPNWPTPQKFNLRIENMT